MNTGKILTTSKLIEKVFLGIQLLFKLSIMFNISFLSLIRDGKFSAIFFSTISIKDSAAVLQPLVITLAEW